MLTQWLLDGALEDPHHEFFIASDPTVADDRLWHDKYSIRCVGNLLPCTAFSIIFHLSLLDVICPLIVGSSLLHYCNFLVLKVSTIQCMLWK